MPERQPAGMSSNQVTRVKDTGGIRRPSTRVRRPQAPDQFEAPAGVRVLLVADTHIGFDLPGRPRIQRRRRGHDFMANFQAALAPAMAGRVDIVVHGGDLLYRRRVAPALVEAALEPLARVAATGVPVFLVPGNHEGSQIPRTLLTAHPNLHVFHEPMTVGLAVAGVRVDVAGFPFSRAAAREIGTLVRATGATGGAGATGDAIRAGVDADIRLLCIHQAVEGAQVGVANYTFRSGADVVPGHAVPQGFAAVLAGHIHRGQVLRRDLGGRPLACPVVYPGSVERTSFAEREETKGYATLTVIAGTQGTAPAAGAGGSVAAVRFHPLPARPMHVVDIDPRGMGPGEITHQLRSELAALPADAVVRVRLSGPVAPDTWPAVAAARVRSLAPPTMNVSVGHPTGLAPSGLGR